MNKFKLSIFFLLFLIMGCTKLDFLKKGSYKNNNPKPIKDKDEYFISMDKFSENEELILEDTPKEIVEKYNYTPIKEFIREEERKVYNIKISSDNKYAFVITSFKIYRILLDTLKEDKVFDHRRIVDGGFTGIELSSDGSMIVGGTSWETRAHLYDWNGKPTKKFFCKQKNSYVENISFSPDNKFILLSCLQFGKSIKETYIYNLDGELISRNKIPHIYSEFTPDGKHFVSYEKDELTYWNLKGKQIQNWKTGLDIVSLSFLKDENLLLMGNSKEWFLLKIEEDENKLSKIGKAKAEFDNFPEENYSLNPEFKSFQQLIANGKLIISGGKGGAYLWSIKGKELKFYSGHIRNVSAVGISSDETFMITASPERTVVWKK